MVGVSTGGVVWGRTGVVVVGGTEWAVLRLAWAGCPIVARPSVLGLAGGSRSAGANPRATDSGSEARPMCCPASWLAAQAIDAAQMIPRTALIDQMTLWRVTAST